MEFNFKCMIFKLILQNNTMDACFEIALRHIPQKNLTNEMSTLVHVMACCRQAASHYLRQWWSRCMAPPSHNMLINSQRYPIAHSHGSFWGVAYIFLGSRSLCFELFLWIKYIFVLKRPQMTRFGFLFCFCYFFSVKFSKSLLWAFCVTAPILHNFTFLLNMQIPVCIYGTRHLSSLYLHIFQHIMVPSHHETQCW